MESLYLLIPLSAVLVLFILAVFGWAVQQGQFDDVEAAGQQILIADRADTRALDADQVATEPAAEK